MQTALSNGTICPVIMLVITFASQTCYVWSGVGELVYGGNTYLGVGSLGKVSTITEGIEVRADGTSIELSGIDSTWLGETMTDVRLGAPATLYFGLLSLTTGQLLGNPYPIFRGSVDQPTISVSGQTFSIKLALENKLVDLQRPNMRRYTSADQRLAYPTDSAFGWVEQLSDQSLIWGQ
jgi:hypothetical protein